MGQGASQSYGISAQLGVTYDLGMIQVGANYQTPVAMTYKRVFDSPDKFGNTDGVPEDMKLTQHQEKVGLDIRWINWSEAKGYKEFGWNGQWVFAVSREYKIDKLALRAGYNYGKSPIGDYTLGANAQNPVSIPDLANPSNEYQVMAFNLVDFPAIAEHHITLGAGYQFTKHFTLNVSYVYSPQSKKKITSGSQTILETKMSQQSICIGLEKI